MTKQFRISREVLDVRSIQCHWHDSEHPCECHVTGHTCWGHRSWFRELIIAFRFGHTAPSVLIWSYQAPTRSRLELIWIPSVV